MIYFSVSHLRRWASEDKLLPPSRCSQHLAQHLAREQGAVILLKVSRKDRRKREAREAGMGSGQREQVPEGTVNNSCRVSRGWWQRRQRLDSGNGDVRPGRGWRVRAHHPERRSTPWPRRSLDSRSCAAACDFFLQSQCHP